MKNGVAEGVPSDSHDPSDKERFDKEQIGVKEPFPVNKCQLPYKNKEHLALRNNFRVTKKFLIAKFECILSIISILQSLQVRQQSEQSEFKYFLTPLCKINGPL